MLGQGARRSCRINFREGWCGYLWQERFASSPLSEQHLLAAARYLEMNPVAAGLVDQPGDYRWSSARAHLEGKDDRLVKVVPLLAWVVGWRDFLTLSFEEELDVLHLHERTGRLQYQNHITTQILKIF